MSTILDGMAYGIMSLVLGRGARVLRDLNASDVKGIPDAYKHAARDLAKLYSSSNGGLSVLALYKREDKLVEAGSHANFGWKLAVCSISRANGSPISLANQVETTNVPKFTARLVDDHLTWEGEDRTDRDMLLARSGRARANPDREFLVLRVDGNSKDTYAVPYDGDVDDAISEAIDLAIPDDRAVLEYAIVTASDAGAARIMKARWRPYAKDITKNPRRSNPASRDFLVLMIDQDPHDTYAVPYDGDSFGWKIDDPAVVDAVNKAIDLAIPDDGAMLEVAIVSARDAGAARLMALTPTSTTRKSKFRNYGTHHGDDPRVNPGHEIGRTKSGKRVLDSKSASEYSDFTSSDHRDAAYLHQKHARNLRSSRQFGAGGAVAADEHHALWREHNRMAQSR